MSIRLTTPFTVAIGGSQVENDTDGAMTGITIDFIGRVYTVTFQVGTLIVTPPAPASGTLNLNPGPQGVIQNQNQVVTVHMDTGAWSDNHGHSGTITGQTLQNIINGAVGDRNTGEAFMAVPGGLMPGVITQWTQI